MRTHAAVAVAALPERALYGGMFTDTHTHTITQIHTHTHAHTH